MATQYIFAALLVLVPLALFAVLFRAVRRKVTLSTQVLGGVLVVGGVCAVGAWALESWLWHLTELNVEPSADGAKSSLLAMLLFAAPLEEGVKVLVIWPLYRLRRFHHRADGLLAATAVATGFAAVENVLYLMSTGSQLPVLRALLGSVAHVFFAGVWGYVLGQRSRLHWLGATWFLAMLFHGLFDHIVFGRGPGTLVVGALLSLTMGVVMALIVKDVFQDRTKNVPPPSARLQHLTLEELTQRMRKRDQPLMLHWIVLGAFVNTGVVLSCLAAAVYLGHQLGVDFAAGNEGDMRSNGPLVLLGTAIMAAFPISGYLVARASGARSVLEPAMGAATAIAAVVALLSMAAPVAVVFALAVAPVAFGLACGGAWFGLVR